MARLKILTVGHTVKQSSPLGGWEGEEVGGRETEDKIKPFNWISPPTMTLAQVVIWITGFVIDSPRQSGTQLLSTVEQFSLARANGSIKGWEEMDFLIMKVANFCCISS